MIKLLFYPQARFDTLTITVYGNSLIDINGEKFDFSRLEDGQLLPLSAVECEFVAEDVKRIDGVLHIPLLLPIAADASDAARFPEPITVTESGPVELPV